MSVRGVEPLFFYCVFRPLSKTGNSPLHSTVQYTTQLLKFLRHRGGPKPGRQPVYEGGYRTQIPKNNAVTDMHPTEVSGASAALEGTVLNRLPKDVKGKVCEGL